MVSLRRVVAGAASLGFDKFDIKLLKADTTHAPELEHDHAEQKSIIPDSSLEFS